MKTFSISDERISKFKNVHSEGVRKSMELVANIQYAIAGEGEKPKDKFIGVHVTVKAVQGVVHKMLEEWSIEDLVFFMAYLLDSGYKIPSDFTRLDSVQRIISGYLLDKIHDSVRELLDS